jgi:hypothetical protein
MPRGSAPTNGPKCLAYRGRMAEIVLVHQAGRLTEGVVAFA